jgi:hypothetical protein
MDVTITFDKVTALIGPTLPSLAPRPTFKSIRVLRRHLEHALQNLPCPQSTYLGWKGLVMSCGMYTLLLPNNAFRLPVDPGLARIFTRAAPNKLTPLTRTEQATVDTAFAQQKHYFQSMQNIEHACFTVLDASIDDAFKVSNNPAIVGWHAGIVTRKILDQLSQIYGHPTLAALELDDVAFPSQYSAANAPKVLFRCIKNCAEIAILGNNPYTDCQLINNAIRLLLTTGLYIRPFKVWDRLLPVAQTWIKLHRLIQEAFQHCLNATAPTAGHHGYATAQPYQQNTFGILGETESDNKEPIANTVATQMAALTYQSQRMQSMAANTSQRHDMQLAQLAANQEAHHATMHQLIDSLNAIAFNISDAGRGIGCFGGGGRGYEGRGRGGRSCM